MDTLTIRLSAPLQSFGTSASKAFYYRNTDIYPTKSMVTGLMAAALGYDKTNSAYDQKTQELGKLPFAIRVDQPGTVLTDLQIIQYKAANGSFQNKIARKEYVQDATFLVAIGADREFIKNLAYKLLHPTYTLYYGRKSCPIGILRIKIYQDKNPVEALKAADWVASEWYQKNYRENKFKAEIFADANLIKNSNNNFKLKTDQAVSFTPNHIKHTTRAVAHTTVTLDNPLSEEKQLLNYKSVSTEIRKAIENNTNLFDAITAIQ